MIAISTPAFKVIKRKGLDLYPLKGLSRERWLELRNMGGALGGSDVGSIMNWNSRFSRIELFYQKIGITFSNQSAHNQYSYWGTQIESPLMTAAQFYDFNDPESYMYNHNEGIMCRRITPFKYSIRNKNVPWANANVDGLIDYNNKTFMARRLAESKCTSRQAMEMWETIPPYHIGQVMLYMHVLKPMLLEDVAEIYYLVDGNKFTGWEIPQQPTLLDMIIERCEDFSARVQKGLEIVQNELNPDLRTLALQEIEPSPDNTMAYEKFLTELYKKKKLYKVIKGTQRIYDQAVIYKELGHQIKSLTEQRQVSKNIIWQELYRQNAEVIDFGKLGKITYSDKLYVNVKQSGQQLL